MPFEQRVDKAMQGIYAQRNWTPVQRRWLKRLAQQLIHEVVLDRDTVQRNFSGDGGACSWTACSMAGWTRSWAIWASICGIRPAEGQYERCRLACVPRHAYHFHQHTRHAYGCSGSYAQIARVFMSGLQLG